MRALLLSEYASCLSSRCQRRRSATMRRSSECGRAASAAATSMASTVDRPADSAAGDGSRGAGVIERVGEGVTDFTVGDRVSFDSTVSCGEL